MAIDLRGYGDSDKPTDLSDYTMDILVKDLKVVIENLGNKVWNYQILYEFINLSLGF